MASDTNTSWMDRVWYVKSVNPGSGSFSLNVTTSDMVMLDPKSMTITRQPNLGPTFHRPKSGLSPSHPWGQWTEAQPDWLSGVTSGGDSSFLIIRDSDHQFTCYCTHLQPLLAFRSLPSAFIPLAVGAVFGTLSGAAVGAAAGSLGSGLLVGVATALASSLATLGARRYLTRPVITGSTGTWVANDGGAGGVAGVLKDSAMNPEVQGAPPETIA